VRSRAYAGGGCPWLLLVDPPDPEGDRVGIVFEVWDLTDPAATTPPQRALDRIHVAVPIPATVVEGTVNRIKMIKRQMFIRTKFDLLRKRVLLATLT
jgi:hypothetical protein